MTDDDRAELEALKARQAELLRQIRESTKPKAKVLRRRAL